MSTAGETLTETLTLIDPAGDPVTGATWTVLLARDPNALAFTPVIADNGDGTYLFTYATTPTTPPGSYYLLVEADDAFHQQFEIEWQLDPLQYAGISSAPRRRDIRQRIAADLDDYRALNASGGSETTFTDPLELLDFDDLYIGAHLLITSGDAANVGQVRRVTASSMSASTITFAPALPAPIQPGDTADLYNLRGRGVRLAEYNLAISAAVNEVRRMICLEEQATPATVTYDNTVIPIPDRWIAVCDARTSVDDGDSDLFFAIPPARYEGTPGWYLRAGDRTVFIGGRYREMLDGREVTLTGYVPHPDVTSDESPIFVDAEWLINTV
jgi:hypothetical protein